MIRKLTRLTWPVAAGLLAALLCFLPTDNLYAQFAIGSTTATAFQGQAAAVTGLAAGSAVSVADTAALSASGGALEAAALEAPPGGRVGVGASHAARLGGRPTASDTPLGQ